MNNFEILKTEDGLVMYVDGEFHDVDADALLLTREQREALFDLPRQDPKADINEVRLTRE